MTARHKYCDLIIAWARDGAEIEVKYLGGSWTTCFKPGWYDDCEYRIKPEPEPKPDIVCYTRRTRYECPPYRRIDDNLKLTYDGETGELKSAEVIKP